MRIATAVKNLEKERHFVFIRKIPEIKTVIRYLKRQLKKKERKRGGK